MTWCPDPPSRRPSQEEIEKRIDVYRKRFARYLKDEDNPKATESFRSLFSDEMGALERAERRIDEDAGDAPPCPFKGCSKPRQRMSITKRDENTGAIVKVYRYWRKWCSRHRSAADRARPAPVIQMRREK